GSPVHPLLPSFPTRRSSDLKVAVARFSQNMAILLSSGVPILEGLAITARTAGNKVVEKAIMDSRVSISQGKTVAEPLGESKIFPDRKSTRLNSSHRTISYAV